MHFILISDYKHEFKTLMQEASNSDEKYKNWMEKCSNKTVSTQGGMYHIDTEDLRFRN